MKVDKPINFERAEYKELKVAAALSGQSPRQWIMEQVGPKLEKVRRLVREAGNA